jgi:hypothetical protein
VQKQDDGVFGYWAQPNILITSVRLELESNSDDTETLTAAVY